MKTQLKRKTNVPNVPKFLIVNLLIPLLGVGAATGIGTANVDVFG